MASFYVPSVSEPISGCFRRFHQSEPGRDLIRAREMDLALDDLIRRNRRGRRRDPVGSRPIRRRASKDGQGRERGSAPIALKVSNLGPAVTEADLSILFGEVGRVERLRLSVDHAGRSNGWAEVRYASRREALIAREKYHQYMLDGRPIVVDVQ